MSSLFGAPAAPSALFSMKAGKMALAGTTVTSDDRKGMLLIRKADDGLMHLIWQDRGAGTVEDDLIVFPGDATMRQIPACKDGFAMVLEFTTGRKLFFWSQEMRKKGLDWTKAEDVTKELELVQKANSYLSGNTAPAPAAPAGIARPSKIHLQLPPHSPRHAACRHLPPVPGHQPSVAAYRRSARLRGHVTRRADGDALGPGRSRPTGASGGGAGG